MKKKSARLKSEAVNPMGCAFLQSRGVVASYAASAYTASPMRVDRNTVPAIVRRYRNSQRIPLWTARLILARCIQIATLSVRMVSVR